MTKASELRQLSDDVLTQRLAETKEELFNLRFQHATGQLDDTTRLGELRREIARLHTLQRAREIEAAEQFATQEQR
jgi:large subunit ribosomal protein L29